LPDCAPLLFQGFLDATLHFSRRQHRIQCFVLAEWMDSPALKYETFHHSSPTGEDLHSLQIVPTNNVASIPKSSALHFVFLLRCCIGVQRVCRVRTISKLNSGSSISQGSPGFSFKAIEWRQRATTNDSYMHYYLHGTQPPKKKWLHKTCQPVTALKRSQLLWYIHVISESHSINSVKKHGRGEVIDLGYLQVPVQDSSPSTTRGLKCCPKGAK